MKTVTACHGNRDVFGHFRSSFVTVSVTSLIYHLPTADREGADHDDR